MLKRLVDKYNSLSADGVVGVWLAVWWLANLFTAGCSELANDEAYYHIFAQNLAWGYYDHPPMTALLVWLGESLFAGELGVRFFIGRSCNSISDNRCNGFLSVNIGNFCLINSFIACCISDFDNGKCILLNANMNLRSN